ncbi:hypothetical protein [Aneurinibacillus aneurinilyticus]|uniref:hypothetical protein n=1 Tax=Aneurinibacillus aneurinilyticus TaxID=1391 RepID=UPI0023F3E89A|nr:hypothetical protein [Aneurinibacillus aneurinilyticus]
MSNPKESFKNLRRDLEGLYYQVKDGSWETRGQLAGNFVMSTISDKGIGKVLKVTPKSQGTPKPKETQQPTQGMGKVPGMPSIVQSRINLRNGSAAEGAGFNHVLDRHFNPSKNASQFTVTPNELKTILQSKEVVKTPVTRVLQAEIKLPDGTTQIQARYVREVTLNSNIGIDKFSGSPTNVMTVLTDKYGNLVTTTPGVIK